MGLAWGEELEGEPALPAPRIRRMRKKRSNLYVCVIMCLVALTLWSLYIHGMLVSTLDNTGLDLNNETNIMDAIANFLDLEELGGHDRTPAAAADGAATDIVEKETRNKRKSSRTRLEEIRRENYEVSQWFYHTRTVYYHDLISRDHCPHHQRRAHSTIPALNDVLVLVFSPHFFRHTRWYRHPEAPKRNFHIFWYISQRRVVNMHLAESQDSSSMRYPPP